MWTGFPTSACAIHIVTLRRMPRVACRRNERGRFVLDYVTSERCVLALELGLLAFPEPQGSLDAAE